MKALCQVLGWDANASCSGSGIEPFLMFHGHMPI
ncbi:hypothetical protein M2144_003084, partial [Lachnospiraceae bacterium PFB1-22]